MTPYKNISEKSGIHAYEIGSDHIIVQFKSGGTYLYTNAVTGEGNVAQMKTLAIAGSRLATFISTQVREKFAERLPDEPLERQ